MIVFEVTKKSGKAKKFSFEEKLSEVTLSRFVSFKETVDIHKPESLAKYEAAETPEAKEQLLATLQVTDLNTWMDYYLKFIKFWTKIPESYARELGEEEIGFLYGSINKVIASFDNQTGAVSFSHQGEEFMYPPRPVNAILGHEEPMKGMRIIDTINALQFEMFAGQLGKSGWAVLPKIVAILCKKKGEEMPLDSIERDQWIADRSNLFNDLPMDVALQAAFFFGSPKSSSGSDSSQSLIQEAKHQITRHRSRSGRSTGGKPFLSRLLSLASLTAAR